LQSQKVKNISSQAAFAYFAMQTAGSCGTLKHA